MTENQPSAEPTADAPAPTSWIARVSAKFARITANLAQLSEPLIAVTIATLLLAFLIWPGVLFIPGKRPVETGSPAAPTPANPASPDGHGQGNTGSPDAVPGGKAAEGPPVANSHAPSSNPTAQPSPSAISADALAALLDNSVVVIVGTDTAGKQSVETGFFVAPKMIVTNRHVVEAIDQSSIKIAGKAFAAPLAAKVVAQSPAGPTLQARDLALLAVDQPGKGFLKLGESPAKLSRVIAVGYSNLLLDSDPVLVEGVVNQKPDTLPVKFIAHSANIGKGGAGGPLVDACGRVVGVNTAAVSGGDAGNGAAAPTIATLAQDVSELRDFLTANGVTTDGPAQGPCAASAPGPAN